jgi:hypothetical protein
LKENGNVIIKNLGNLSFHTEYLQSQGSELQTEVKQRKVEVMGQINDYFDKVIKQVQLKKAEVKLKYCKALKVEEARIAREQENFEKHSKMINFCKENV